MDSPGPREDMVFLTVTVTSEKGVVWIVVRGEVDLSNREQLRSRLADIDLRRAKQVYLDLRLLTFCDSAGCEILIRFKKRAESAGHDVRIHRAKPVVRKLMSILGEPAPG